MRILILTGGNSSERKISFLSARNVKNALTQSGHMVKIYDLKNGYLAIKKLSKNFDVLFPVLHGEEGEGGVLHKFISKIDKPIVGTRNFSDMQKAWYKIPFKKFCDKNKIKTPRWKEIKNAKDIISFGFPCVLKTSSGGSSREVVILKSKDDLKSREFKKIISLQLSIFVEEYKNGVEVTCGIVNDKALPLLEIVPPNGSWFNYKNKYDNSSKEIPFAPSVNRKMQKNVQNIALKIFKSFDLGSYCRIDFIISNNIPFVLELNTIPGMTAGSLLPKQAKAAGISFPKLMEMLIKSAK
ncbi:MAG TPA: hypothetical protein VES68_03280 [Candidatus Sulfotelmatobacter sp.]|nr:hypothetical protein [Candidatus Sulfotelmatobacter sp.]